MLVFSRMKNQVFYVGNDVTITVVEIRGDKVRLGIDAPKDISVDRYEVRVAKSRLTQEGLVENEKDLG